MDSTSHTQQALDSLAEQLAVLPVEVHLAGDAALIERCSRFLANALRFWNAHRTNVPVIEALTVILSHDYHHVMKTGFREVRHLINIYGAIGAELKKVRDQLATRQPVEIIQEEALRNLNAEALEIDRALTEGVDSAIGTLESVLTDLKKASIKLWNRTSRDPSVIPKGLHFFISHASEDKDLAVAITTELECTGIATWRDDKDIDGGDSIPSEIAQGLEEATHFGLLYSDVSKDRAWVKTEFENALMLREKSGRPKIIPLLLDGLKPPTILGNIKGLPFDTFQEGMELLWRSLDVPPGSRISLDVLFKFQQRARTALDHVTYCNRADRFIKVDEETFDSLEDIETYALSFPIRCEPKTSRRFEWTEVSWPAGRPEELRPSFEWDFYTYRRVAIAGSSLLKSMAATVRRLLDMLDKIDATPLPREILLGA
jgi:hypothetical protein